MIKRHCIESPKAKVLNVQRLNRRSIRDGKVEYISSRTIRIRFADLTNQLYLTLYMKTSCNSNCPANLMRIVLDRIFSTLSLSQFAVGLYNIGSENLKSWNEDMETVLRKNLVFN